MSTAPQYIGKTVTIAPMKIKMIVEDLKLKVGKTAVISPRLEVDDPDVKIPVAYTFDSWHEDIASVTEDGVVTGLKKGTAAICVGVDPKYSSKNYTFSNSNFVIVRVASDTIDIEQTIVALSKSAFTYNGKEKQARHTRSTKRRIRSL